LHIADFGAAVRVPRGLKRWLPDADAEGTPEYLSPERIRGSIGDARTDVYGLGILLYELIAGVPPFAGAKPGETISMHLTASPDLLRAHRADVPPALEAVVSRALRRRPRERYQSAAEMLIALSHLDRVDVAPNLTVPDPPLRGKPMKANRRLWRFVGLEAAGYAAIVGAIVAVGPSFDDWPE
jgi:serine/threonine protein kinase